VKHGQPGCKPQKGRREIASLKDKCEGRRKNEMARPLNSPGLYNTILCTEQLSGNIDKRDVDPILLFPNMWPFESERDLFSTTAGLRSYSPGRKFSDLNAIQAIQPLTPLYSTFKRFKFENQLFKYSSGRFLHKRRWSYYPGLPCPALRLAFGNETKIYLR
jgi:hypothetical protein